MLCSVYCSTLVSAFSFGVYTPLEVISDISLNTPYRVRSTEYNVLYCILVYSVLRTICVRILYRVLRTVSCKVANLLETDYSSYNASMIFSDRHRSSHIPCPVNTFPFTPFTNYHCLLPIVLPLNARHPVDDLVPCRWRDPQYKHLSTSLLVLNIQHPCLVPIDQ